MSPPIFYEAAMRRFFFPDHNRRFIPTDHFDRFSPINDFSLIHLTDFPLYTRPRKTKTQGERLVGSLSAIKARAPVLGGNFGVWGGLFSTFDCAVKGYRQKEDPWNAIISGFLTGGSLALRCESLFFILFFF